MSRGVNLTEAQLKRLLRQAPKKARAAGRVTLPDLYESDIETTIVGAMMQDGWRALKQEYNFDTVKKLTLGEPGMCDHLFLRPAKVGGICEIERRTKDKPYLKELYYLRAVLNKRLAGKYFSPWEAIRYLENAYLDGVCIDQLREIVMESWSWTKFTDLIIEARESLNGGDKP